MKELRHWFADVEKLSLNYIYLHTAFLNYLVQDERIRNNMDTGTSYKRRKTDKLHV